MFIFSTSVKIFDANIDNMGNFVLIVKKSDCKRG